MAAFNWQQSVCTGRGWDAAGFCGKIRAFLTGTPTAGGGGCGWFEHDGSQVAAGTNPFVTFCDKNAPGANVPAKYLQVYLPTATSGFVWFFFWLGWNSTTHTGIGLYGAFSIPTLDAADFIYDIRGGSECLMIGALTVTNWENFFIDEITLDSNLIDNVSATTAVTNFADNGNAQFRGFDLLGGSFANMVDVNGNSHFSIEFVSGTNWRIKAFNNAARGAGDLVWQSNNFTALAAGIVSTQITGTAQNSSGVTIGVYLQGGSAGTAADATILFRPNKIRVGVGEGAQFTDLNYYFISDFSQNKNCVNSFQVLSKSGDELAVNRLYRPFTAGSRVGSYLHPYFVAGNSTLWSEHSGIPYYNVAGTISNFQNNLPVSEQTIVDISTTSLWITNPRGGQAILSTDDNYLTRMSPDRKSRWALQRPGIVERKAHGDRGDLNQASGNTGYGQLKNAIVGASTGMSPNIHGRSLSGIDYIYFRLSSYYAVNSSSWALMFRETQSAT